MRALIRAVLSIAVVFYISEFVVATVESRSTELTSKTISDSPFNPPHVFDMTFSKESRKRFLRFNQETDGASALVSTADEERASNVMNHVTNKLKTTNAAKKLIATGKKTKNTLRKIPGVGTFTKLDRYRKYSGLYKNGWSPDKAKQAGKFKSHDEFVQYQAFHRAAQRKKAKVHPTLR